MTLIVAMIGKDGIAMAADSREMTAEGTYSDTVRKIIRVGANCCIGVSGDASFALPKVEEVRRELSVGESDNIPAIDVSIALRKIMRKAIDSLQNVPGARGNTKYHPEFIVAGWNDMARENAVPVIYVQRYNEDYYEPKDQQNYSKIGLWQAITWLENHVPTQRFSSFSVEDLSTVAIYFLCEACYLSICIGKPFSLCHVYKDHSGFVDSTESERQAQRVRKAIVTQLKDLLPQ